MPTAHDKPTPPGLRLARQRLRAQHLVGPPLDGPAAVVRWLGAVQAQDYLGAKWAVAQRARGCTDADVEQAFACGAILRTHVMRPTWHFVVPADLRWLLQLTAPRVYALSAGYYRKLGLDDATFARSNAALARALQGGHHLTRAELGAVLQSAGVIVGDVVADAADAVANDGQVDAGGLRATFLIMRAELDAVVCSGARRGKQFTYAAFDERVPATQALRRDEALARLTRRYFQGHGPARPQDFAWWSGLKVSDARAGIAMLGSELDHVRDASLDDQGDWFAAPQASSRVKTPTVHLLPNFDEYVVAFRDHTPLVDARLGARFARQLGAREGLLANHLVVLNGQVVGGWRRTLGPGKGKGKGLYMDTASEVLITAQLLTPLQAAERAALNQAANRYGRFLGRRACLVTTRVNRSR